MHDPQIDPLVPARQGIAFAMGHSARLQTHLGPTCRALSQVAQSAGHGPTIHRQIKRLGGKSSGYWASHVDARSRTDWALCNKS